MEQEDEQITALRYHDDGAQHITADTKEGIRYETKDGGQTWEQLGDQFSESAASRD